MKTAAVVNTKFGIRVTRRQVAYHQGLEREDSVILWESQMHALGKVMTKYARES
jgi:hypothetical protein